MFMFKWLISCYLVVAQSSTCGEPESDLSSDLCLLQLRGLDSKDLDSKKHPGTHDETSQKLGEQHGGEAKEDTGHDDCSKCVANTKTGVCYESGPPFNKVPVCTHCKVVEKTNRKGTYYECVTAFYDKLDSKKHPGTHDETSQKLGEQHGGEAKEDTGVPDDCSMCVGDTKSGVCYAHGPPFKKVPVCKHCKLVSSKCRKGICTKCVTDIDK
jgi:hypothetical protein